jgi:hypothetical protein
MKKDPITLESLPKVRDVLDALKAGHPMFPVLNRSGQLIGKISSNYLIVLIEQKAWYKNSFSREQDIPSDDKFVVESETNALKEGTGAGSLDYDIQRNTKKRSYLQADRLTGNTK